MFKLFKNLDSTQIKTEPIILSILLVLLSILITSCTDSSSSSISSRAESYPVTYSFFDVDVNSTLSNSLKSRLNNILGDHSTETRNTINLNINREGFLKKHLPYFYELHLRLNSTTGKLPTSSTTITGGRKIELVPERVEHNTIKLSYRYAINKNLPFNYVEFLFSDFNATPLLIRVNFKKDDLNVVDTLKQKYGEPKEIKWKEKNGKSLCWQNGDDLLILSFVPDQFGKPNYESVIYFGKRLEDLLEAEAALREAKVKSDFKSGQTLF
ncbi:MAG: hypothetical protein HQK64_05505 [Desulfamplus sp.]|nr:hypothetical protein [Desulfamplus sp.]